MGRTVSVLGALCGCASVTLLLAACGGSGSADPKSDPPARPTASLTAAADVVASGAATTLTWSSTNATSCTASGGWSSNTLGTSGSQSTGAITSATTYSITCGGPGGMSPTVSTAVNVTPT